MRIDASYQAKNQFHIQSVNRKFDRKGTIFSPSFANVLVYYFLNEQLFGRFGKTKMTLIRFGRNAQQFSMFNS